MNKRQRFFVDCVFSTQAIVYPTEDQSICYNKKNAMDVRMNCATGLGSSVVVTATFGLIAVSHVIKKLSE